MKRMTKIKRNSLIVLFICLFFLVGCKNDVEIVNTSNQKGERSTNAYQNINVKGSGNLKCSRQANAMSGLSADLNYYVSYTKGIINTLHSVEKVSGDNQDALDEYEEAYKKLKDNYKDIKYYDFTVTRDEKSVTNDIVINYDKVNIKKVIEVEGSEIYDNKNRPTLKKWLKLGEKSGLTCEGVAE